MNDQNDTTTQESDEQPADSALTDSAGSRKFTTEDFNAVWHFHADYFIDVLNGDYAIEEAREDLRGLIGSKYDPRVSSENEPVEARDK